MEGSGKNGSHQMQQINEKEEGKEEKKSYFAAVRWILKNMKNASSMHFPAGNVSSQTVAMVAKKKGWTLGWILTLLCAANISMPLLIFFLAAPLGNFIFLMELAS